MVGRWMDDRERQLRGSDWRRSDYTGRYSGEERSWDDDGERSDVYGARRGGPDRDRAFGEGETGAGYGRRPASESNRGSAARGWQDRHFGGVSPAMRQGAYGVRPRFARPDYRAQDYRTQNYGGPAYGGGGRFYGDDAEGSIYREEYGQGGVEYGDVPPGYDAQRSPTRERYHAEGYGQSGYGTYPGEYGQERGRRSGGYEDERGYGGAGEFLHRAGERVAAWFGAGSEFRIYDPDYQGAPAGARGLGPQGYRRSDERISDDVHERLTEDAWVDASGVSISVAGGEVTLSGSVDTRETKHRAERIVEVISGVVHVQNNLRVEKGGFLTRPASGYGDSVLEAQMRRDEPASNGTGGAGGGQSTAGKKN